MGDGRVLYVIEEKLDSGWYPLPRVWFDREPAERTCERKTMDWPRYEYRVVEYVPRPDAVAEVQSGSGTQPPRGAGGRP